MSEHYPMRWVAALFAAIGPVGSLSGAQTLSGSAGLLTARENAANVDWAYNWGIEPDNNPFDGADANFEFVPMIWSANPTGVVGQIDRVFNLESNYGVHVDYVLGFNEPELPDQANMTVQTALDTWEVMTEAFAATDIKLVSPAVSGNGAIQNWLAPFMSEVELRNADANPDNDLQVDAIAYHFYTVGYNAQTEANKLLAQIDQLWADYGRPIWLTEFAGTSFSLDNPVHSIEERTAFNAEFLEILIPAFEAREYVERYAWWQFGALGQPYSKLSDQSGGVYTPTELGEIYSGTTLHEGDTYDLALGETRTNDVHYLKGGELTNTGPALATALRAVDALEGDSVIGGSADFGFEPADDAFLRLRSGTTLRKQGGNTVTLPGTLVDNSGLLLVEEGTLQIEDGAQVTGSGQIRVQPNGVLAFSRDADEEDVVVQSQTILNFGELHVKDHRAVLTGELRLWNESQVRTDGDLVVSGGVAGFGKLVSVGPGTLFLTGAGSNVNGATVSEGDLIVANEDASATGDGDVLVTGTGRLGGYGRVAGLVRVEAGGAVAPGVSRSSHGLTSAPVFDEGVVFDAIDFDFTDVRDDAPLMQTSTLSPALALVSGFDFGPGVNPRNAANDDDEFNVAGFSANSWSNADGAGDYLTFTVAAVDGLAMQLEDVTFELRRNGDGAATHYRVFTSIDGFDGFADGLEAQAFVLDSGDTTTHEITAGYDGSQAVAGPVEVRVYGWNATSDSGNTHFYAASLDASFISDPDSVAFDPTGVLELGGDYTQLDFATLEIDLGGVASGDFDQLLVTGDVSLDGTLDISLLDGFEVGGGHTFDIITANSIAGEFDTVIAPEGYNAIVSYLGSVVRIELLEELEGDFNNDGVVDAADYAVWRNLQSPGNIDLAGYFLWRNNFGNRSQPTPSAAAAPEPTTLALLLLSSLLVVGRRW